MKIKITRNKALLIETIIVSISAFILILFYKDANLDDFTMMFIMYIIARLVYPTFIEPLISDEETEDIE